MMVVLACSTKSARTGEFRWHWRGTRTAAFVAYSTGGKSTSSGKVVDVPTEPSEVRAAFSAQVKFGCYLAHEEAGIVWGWFGRGKAPPFPKFQFSALLPANVVNFVGHLNRHWLQALEMLLDPAHIGILHRSHLRPSQLVTLKDGREITLPIRIEDPPPRIEIEYTEYGYRGAAIRTLEDGTHYVRVTEWVAPFFAFLAAVPGDTHSLYIAVPVDGENTQFWYIGWNAARPLDVEALKANALGGDDPDNFTRGIGSRATLWQQSRAKMAEGHFTGFPTAMHEEVIVPQAQGVRQKFGPQNLGSSDRMIIATRDRLAQLARALACGENATFRSAPICACSIRLPAFAAKGSGGRICLGRDPKLCP